MFFSVLIAIANVRPLLSSHTSIYAARPITLLLLLLAFFASTRSFDSSLESDAD